MKRLMFFLLAGLAVPAWGQMFDYPGGPTEHGSVIVELNVTAEGAVSDCHVKRASGVASLDYSACRMGQHARFHPATDDSGKPRTSVTEFTFHFIVPHAVQSDADLPIESGKQLTLVYNPPREAAQRANGTRGPGQARSAKRLPVTTKAEYPTRALRNREQGRVSVVVDISQAGGPQDCSVVRTSGSYELDSATCNFVMNSFHYTPGTDYYGNPIGDEDLFTMNWVIPNRAPAKYGPTAP